MALSEESKDLLQAQAELWNQFLSYMKPVALAVAFDLHIPDAIHHHGDAATLFQIVGDIGVSPRKIPALRRLLRHLTVTGTFDIQPAAAAAAEITQASSDVVDGYEESAVLYKLTAVSRLLLSESLFPMLDFQLNPFRDPAIGKGLTEWFRHDQPQPGLPAADGCPYTMLHGGVSFWEATRHVNASFNDCMAAESHFLMQIVLKDMSDIFRGIESLVDVAGGHGGAAFSIAAAFPSIKCSVLDLPHVVANAPPTVVSNVQFVAGDMFHSIPQANVVFLKWTLHDWSDDECIKILKNCKQAIPSRDAGGKVIIIDIVVGSQPSDTKLLETQVMFDMAMMEVGGVERDEQEWKKLFLEAGFKDYNIMRLLGLRSIIELYP